MDSKKLAEIERELRHLRIHCHDIKRERLVSLAGSLGRDRKPGFTNEPTYVRIREPALSPPLSIPAHDTLKTGTARSIIRALLDDVDAWRQHLQDQEIDDDH